MIELCRQLEWDSQFFGRRIARIEHDRLTTQSLREILAWCQEQGTECLYFLCSPEDDSSVALAESADFHLVDIRVELNWKAEPPASPPAIVIREFQESDLALIQQIASQSYTNTRFSYDHRFPADRVAELYKEWLTGSCRNTSHKVFVAENQNAPAGFITCQFDSAEVGRIGLLGVGNQSQGKGYGQQLVQTAQQFFNQAGAREVRVVTQGRNIAAQRLYQSCGFRTYKVGLWYHKWFE
jgi:dTDP-4-amino-4,6-dideoxy-D-galactose acyltransferase